MLCNIKTISGFEALLRKKFKSVKKCNHVERGYDEPDTKLFLYYSGAKHVGTFNRTKRVSFLL